MKRTFALALLFASFSCAAEPTKGKADLGDFMLHYESSAESTGIALMGRNGAPSLSVTKEKDKAPVIIIVVENANTSTYYSDTDGDGMIDQALIRSAGITKKFRVTMEMTEITQK